MTEFFQSTHLNCNPPIPSIPPPPLLSKNFSSPEHRDVIFGKVEGMERGVDVMLLSPRDLALLKNNKKTQTIRS